MLKSTRDGFGQGLVEAGAINDKLLVLSADLAESTRSHLFREKYPERFFDVGVAEQNLIGVAAGLAQEGFISVVTSFAEFSPGRNWEQIRISVCYNNVPVKIASTHAGISVGEDGATHQILEDLAILRVLPNISVISPADYQQAIKATQAVIDWPGPCYLRLSRAETIILTETNDVFQIGKADILQNGRDLTILSHGLMVGQVWQAAQKLKNKFSLEIINVHTLKPLDEKTILTSIKKTGKALVVEETQEAGSLFSILAELTAKEYPIPIGILAVKDRFGRSGSVSELLEYFHLAVYDIIGTIRKILKSKDSNYAKEKSFYLN